MCNHAHVHASDLADVIRARLRETGRSAADASRTATGQTDAIARIYRGHEPGWARVVALVKALGLEVYISPPQEAPRSVSSGTRVSDSQIDAGPHASLPPAVVRRAQDLARAIAAAGGDPIPPELRESRPGPLAVPATGPAPSPTSDDLTIPFFLDVRAAGRLSRAGVGSVGGDGDPSGALGAGSVGTLAAGSPGLHTRDRHFDGAEDP